MRYVCERAFNLWSKSTSHLWAIQPIRLHVLVFNSHKFHNQAKDLWEEARWKISTALHYSETWVATRLKRKGEKLVISAHSLWTWPDETQATQSKRFQRRAHWRLLRILMQCGIQFLWEPRGLSEKVNRCCIGLHTNKNFMLRTNFKVKPCPVAKFWYYKYIYDSKQFWALVTVCKTGPINEV